MSSGARARSVGAFAPADPCTVVDTATARRALAASVVAIGRATDPLAEFKSRQPLLEAAMARLGREFDAQQFLESCGIAAQTVAVPGETTEPLVPSDRQRLESHLATARGVESDDVDILEVMGGRAEGYELTLNVAGQIEEAFALPFQDSWVFSPGPIGREDVLAVTAAFRRHFDFTIAVGMHMRGRDDKFIESARAEIFPIRALWDDEADPLDLCEEFPLVFVLTNPTDNGRGYYCALDPFTGATRPYDE